MLTWASVNIIGSDVDVQAGLVRLQHSIVQDVDRIIVELEIEHDESGNRAKTYLYCVEARCPRTQWMIPMSTTWVVSGKRNVIACLKPDPENKRFDIDIIAGATQEQMDEASKGTIQGRDLVYTVDGVEYTTPIAVVRGDFRKPDGQSGSALRPWERSDFMPRPSDIFQERLYCIHWITRDTVGKSRPETFFAAVTDEDLARETVVNDIVQSRLAEAQSRGFIPDMAIEPGANTTQPIRERGWTHWHHLFSPRHLLILSLLRERVQSDPRLIISLCNVLDFIHPSLTGWVGSGREGGESEFTSHVFANQALNTLSNYGQGALLRLVDAFIKPVKAAPLVGTMAIAACDAKRVDYRADVFITDPPYADAVNYHEITEYFISWIERNPPAPLDTWIWDSRRALAIQGEGDEFSKKND